MSDEARDETPQRAPDGAPDDAPERAPDEASEEARDEARGTTLLDAYALIAFLAGGPAAEQVRALLRERDTAVASANLVEALDVSQRLYGVAVSRALEILEPVFELSLVVLSLDLPRARRAAELRAKHYHRSSRPISLADAVLLASARPGDRIATSDPDVLAVAAAEGLEQLVLPGQG
ncbi:MAG: PIN domain-containing protein [Solirubrobacterales bacterium]|nr:PIN domain-containing protein [Solirubrobacterales bacterium]